MFQLFPYALIMLTHRFLFDLATQNSKQHDQAAQGTDRNEQFLDYEILHRIAKPQFTTQHRNLRHLSQALGKATQSKRDKPIQAEETRTPRDTPESVRILKQPATCIGEDRLDLCALNCPTLQLRCCCTSGLSNALEFFKFKN